MNQQEPKKTIQENVLAAIDSGKLKLRSKWYFVLRGAALAVGLVIVGLIALFLISFAIFSLRQNGAWYAPALGPGGYKELFLALPWLIISAVAILFILLELLVKRYEFVYQRPLVYSVLGLAVLVAGGSVIAWRLHIHEQLWMRAQKQNLPLAGRLYRGCCAAPSRNVISGVIVEKIPEGFNLNSREHEEIKIIITPQTHLPFGADFDEGDIVVVFGPRDDHTVEAQGIQEVNEDKKMFPSGKRKY